MTCNRSSWLDALRQENLKGFQKRNGWGERPNGNFNCWGQADNYEIEEHNIAAVANTDACIVTLYFMKLISQISKDSTRQTWTHQVVQSIVKRVKCKIF